MHEFVNALLETLSEIPRCGPAEDKSPCLYELDAELVARRYQALEPDKRALFDGCWRAFSALMLLQSIVHAGAERLYRLVEPAVESMTSTTAGGLTAPLSTAGEISKLVKTLERYINIASTSADALPNLPQCAMLETEDSP